MTGRTRLAVIVCLAMDIAASCAVALAGGEGSPRGAERLADSMVAIQKDLAEIRGHRFLEPVTVERMVDEQVQAYLLRKIDEEYPGDAMAGEQKAYVHFGLLESGDDLRALLASMLADQAAGFYDPDQKKLILLEGRPFPGLALVHELAHALQDQTFDVGGILHKARASDDRLRAAQAMIEGEAMVLSASYVERRPDDPSVREGLEGLSGMASQLRDALEKMRLYPEILQADLMFPYTQGMSWAREVIRMGGQTLMDRLFRCPPESTEQILHPEKMASPRDVPSVIHREVLPDLSSQGYRIVKTNTWGEFSIRELLGGPDDRAAREAATGWDADLYAVYEGQAEATAMIWICVWDSRQDASQFQVRATAWLRGRHPGGKGYRMGTGGVGDRVLFIVEGFDETLRERLARSLGSAIGSGVELR